MAAKHSRTTRFFHWLLAVAMLVQVPLAYLMIAQPLSPEKLGNYALHKSLGLAIFLATVCRLVWKLLKKNTLPDAPPRPFRHLARASHAILYVLTFAMPLVGWLGSSAANFPVSFFGWFTLPDLVNPSQDLHGTLKLAHRWMAYGLFATLVAHIGAAFYHHWVLRDDVLISMVPWGSSKTSDEVE